MKVRIDLAGPPRGKGRGRAVSTASGARVFTDDKTRKYEAQLRFAAQQEMQDRKPIEGPVAVWIEARFAIAPSWSKKRRQAAQDGLLRPCTTPDNDNLMKCCDALNGVVWVDDRQVVDSRVAKIYSERPGLTIIVETVAPKAALPVAGEHGVAPHDEVAFARGRLDRRMGQRVWASCYRNGSPGSADYELGWGEGMPEGYYVGP